VAATKIGPYRVLRLIRRGGGGSVYVGYDQRLKRRVALKLIVVPRERKAREAVVAEARHLAALNHRCIVQIFDVLEVQDHVVLVMEYVNGTDLQRLLQGVEVNLATCLYIAAEISSALAAAHAAGLVHRDLKPANVLLDPSGLVKLTDFGIAQLTQQGDEGEAGTLVAAAGSFIALSPEHIAGDSSDPRSDLFALGVLLYQLVAGRHPFGDGDDALLLQNTVKGAHRPLSDFLELVPPALDELVNQLLQKDAQARPGSALDVRQALLGIRRELPISHGNPLVNTMAGVARDEDTVPSQPDLPSNFANGARSHMLGMPWVFGAVAGWQHSLAKAMGLIALVALATFGLSNSDLFLAEVYVKPVHLLGNPGASPSSVELTGILNTAIDAHAGLQRSLSPQATPLEMQVECNALVCALQLVHKRPEQAAIKYLMLLPGASTAVWKSAVDEALESLF